MKKLIALLLVFACIFCLAACKDKEEEAAKEKAIELVGKLYSAQNQMLEDLGGFSMATSSTPTINKSEKVGDCRYAITGSVTGIHMKDGVSLQWTADWSVTMEKDENGEYKVSTSPAPVYGEFKYLTN